MAHRILIKGAYVLSQDPQIGELAGGDVLIEGDRIAQVGTNLNAEGAKVIDATGDIVIPGFIDTHRHTWETSIRTCAPDYALITYFSAILDQFAPVEQIGEQLSLAVARVMNEGSLYDPELAALAIKQARGDLVEAAFLLRAYRTTLPRFGYAEPVDTSAMEVQRRISASVAGRSLKGRVPKSYSSGASKIAPAMSLEYLSEIWAGSKPVSATLNA